VVPTQLPALQELDVLCKDLFAGDRRDMCIASITFDLLRSSVTRAQRTSLCAVIESLSNVVEEGAVCLERGDQQFRLHSQCMLHL
jgi:hypothetical protein